MMDNETWLQECVQGIEEGYTQLKMLLERHNEWQNFHDTLETVDASLGTSKFRQSVYRFLCEKEKMGELLRDATNNALPNQNDFLEQMISRTAAYLEVLEAGCKEDDYESMRKNFDDVFYQVDQVTLNSLDNLVKSAERHADDLRRRRDELRSRRRPYA